MKYIAPIFLCFLCTLAARSQKLWTESDRKYLLENLARTRDSIITETKNLSEAQWNFKESPASWSINQVVEHLAIWELILDRETSQALLGGPHEEKLIRDAGKADSAVVALLMEAKPHITTDYTKPFTFTVPMGTNQGKNNVAWFLKMRNEGINYVDSTTTDLRYYFRPGKNNDVHQIFIIIFAHTSRHLRQIRRIKANPRYPSRSPTKALV